MSSKTRKRARTAGSRNAGSPARGGLFGIGFLLVVLVFAIYGQTLGHPFVNYDDPSYVVDPPMVAKGLSLAGIGWAFTHVHSSNWHPLTTIVDMLDCQLFGQWAGGHHLVSVLLHAACAVLLLLLLVEMTGAVWRSGFAAAVFAVHPLRVESVAWVAELKDVLSGLFFMLTLRAYLRYVRQPDARRRYMIVVLWMVLGLMSKPMLVTLPFVLLLLDYWPLGRVESRSRLRALVREKLPLMGVAVLSCVATILAQNQAIQLASPIPFPQRIGNALVAYVVYLWKLIVPMNLAVLYPLPRGEPARWEVVGAILLLAALSAGAWIFRKRHPYLLMGWLWYLGMLVPVIGLLQVGLQAYADRYTYLPELGICIGITWLGADWAENSAERRAGLGTVAALIVCGLTVAACLQCGYWRDSETLWMHTLECTGENSVAHNSLGTYLLGQRRVDEAAEQYRAAIAIDPNYAEAHDNLGIVLCQQGRPGEGIAEYRESIRIHPSVSTPYDNLANALYRGGAKEAAVTEYQAALKIDPGKAGIHYNLAVTLSGMGHIDEAIAQYRQALRLEPGNVGAQNNLAYILASETRPSAGDAATALDLAEKANQATGNKNPVMLHTLALALAANGRFPEAVRMAQQALEFAAPDTPLAMTLRRELDFYNAGKPVQAVESR